MQSASIHGGRRLWGLLLLVIGSLGTLLTAAAADDKKDADPKKDEPSAFSKAKQTFQTETGDGVTLKGDFYPQNKDAATMKNASVVIFLHSVGPGKKDASRKDFQKLPEIVWNQGFAVLTFDFRGYGESKSVTPNAYGLVHNGQKPSKLDAAKDFTSVDSYANMVSDVVAAKVWLANQNNQGNCNANNIAIIGSEQGAVVGLLFLANEFVDFDRGREFKKEKLPDQVAQNYSPLHWGFGGGLFGMGGTVIPGKEVDVPTKYEGDDVSCVICLSMRPSLGSSDIKNQIATWLTRPLRDGRTILDKASVYGVYGEKDAACDSYWKSLNNKVFKIAGGKAQSGIKVIKNTNLAGTKMLGSDALKVEEQLSKYLDEVFKVAGAGKLRQNFEKKPSAPEPNPPVFKPAAFQYFIMGTG